MRMRALLVVLAAMLAVGCARVSVERIKGDSDHKTGGVRFYRPEPYLLVTATTDKEGKPQKQTAIVWLPNKNEEYALRVTGWVGTVDADFTLQDGWNLTAFKEKRDTKVPETINAINGTINALAGLKKGDTDIQPLKELPPGLYRLEFVDGHVSKIVPASVFP